MVWKMDWKNILIIIASLKHWWGAEKVASTIGSKLQEKWNTIFYLTFYSAKEKYSFLGKEMCLKEKKSTNIFSKIIKLFTRSYHIAKYCKKYWINDTISFMEESNFPNILSKLFFCNKSKIIVSIRQSVDSMSTFYKFLIKLLYNWADCIIPNSEEEKNNIIQKYDILKKKTITIYNPLDLDLIQTESKKPIQDTNILFNNNFTFITIWRLTSLKNQKFLIDVFFLFNKKYPDTKLLILWDWELKSELVKYINDNNNNIHILWNQFNVYSFLSKSDCFLFASLWEGFPNAILEAMACWLPIISTKFKTWISELIWKNEYWLLIDQNNKKSFLEAMEEIYLDEDIRNNYKQKSLERARYFEIQKIIKKRWSIL